MNKKIFLICILIALTLRFVFAYIYYGSVDVDNAWFTVHSFLDGKNVYETTGYNHTPLWLVLLVFAYKLSLYFSVPFYFLEKIYAIGADVACALLIYLISYNRRLFPQDTAMALALFYLFSPVAILISSFHGQFDSIPLAFMLAAYYVLFKRKPKIFLSAILLGIAVAFKTWPLFLLPVYLLTSQMKLKEKVNYAMIVLCVFFIPISGYLISAPFPVLRNILLYFGTADFGLAVFFEFFTNNNITPFSQIGSYFYGNSALPARVLLVSVLMGVFWFIYVKKMQFADSMVLVLLSVYTFSLKLGAQYLLWIIPFALLTKYKKATVFYALISTITLIANYQGHSSRALFATGGFEYLALTNLHLPWGFMATIWWVTCFAWFITLIINEVNKK